MLSDLGVHVVAIASRGLKGVATWWATTPNGSGGDLFAAPVLIVCRWSDKQEKFVGQLDRIERVSKDVVYVDRHVAVGDYLAPGDQTSFADPTVINITNADKILRFERVPDLRNLESLYKAIR